MERKKLSEAKATFSAVVDSVEERGEPVIIERHGKPVAALVSMDDLERLEALNERRSRTVQSPTSDRPIGALALVGLWADVPDKVIDEMLDDIYRRRDEELTREIDLDL